MQCHTNFSPYYFVIRTTKLFESQDLIPSGKMLALLEKRLI